MAFRPILFSKHNGVDPKDLDRLGVFDPTLNADTLLFPDPMLLRDSGHPEMHAAADRFEEYFETVRKLIAGSGGDDAHPAWKAAYQRLRFPEIQGTCLGYGSDSIRGSGVGAGMTSQLIKTAHQIIKLGIDDPDLFMAMGLFEENFGPDLIGDMFTNVCFEQIVEFNHRICKELSIITHRFAISLANGTKISAYLPANTTLGPVNQPIILLPKDILRELPVALDWRSVQNVSEQNAKFRGSLNDAISDLWSKKTLESKGRLRSWAMSSRDAFGDLLDLIHSLDGKPYDFGNDRLGEIIWRELAEKLASKFPKDIPAPTENSQSELNRVVDTILGQFKHLIEDRDLWRELYTDDGSVRFEKASQRFLYMTALSYCDANNIDVTPEAETGRGPVDFKFSQGSDCKLLVEIKLSKNPKLVKGFERQLDLYQKGERTMHSRYVIIDVGSMGGKLRRIKKLLEARTKQGLPSPQLIVIDGLQKISASHAA